jgi:hypothetical protein
MFTVGIFLPIKKHRKSTDSDTIKGILGNHKREFELSVFISPCYFPQPLKNLKAQAVEAN